MNSSMGRAMSFLLFPWLAVSACGGQAADPSPPAAPGQAVRSWTSTAANLSEIGLYLRNGTARRIRVSSVTLERCRAIREECQRYRLSLELAPGEIRRVMSLHPTARGYEVEWGFDWEYVLDPMSPQDAPFRASGSR